jgi:PAS domain-containing protein
LTQNSYPKDNTHILQKDGLKSLFSLKVGIDSSKDILIRAIDTNYNYLFFNQEYKEVMNKIYHTKVVSHSNLLNCVTLKEDKIKIKNNFDRALAGESHSDIQEYGSAQRTYYESFYNPIFNDKKEIIGAAAFSKNFTEHKNMEEELLKQKNFFEQMFSQSSISTEILDKDGWCERINPKLSKIFGVKPEAMEGKKYNIFKDGEIQRTGVISHFKKVFEEGKAVEWEIQFDIGFASTSQKICVAEKKKVWYHTWAYPIFDKNNNLSNVIVQHLDITDRKETEEKLLEKFKELEQMNKHMIDREIKMIELKERIKELEKEVNHKR